MEPIFIKHEKIGFIFYSLPRLLCKHRNLPCKTWMTMLYSQVTRNNTFVITEYSKDEKYGYNKDYPINIFFLE
jgi:hypothetical protein